MTMLSTVRRPVLRYHGGKWKLAPWITAHFGPHTVYTEAFGGGASVLLRKPKSLGEVYNDLDGDLYNLFCVLRDPLLASRLREQLVYTQYDRREFEAARLQAQEPVEQARRLIVRSFLGFGSAACNSQHRTGFRATATRGDKTGPATEWACYADLLPAVTERLRGVVVENRPATTVLTKFDAPGALHFVDPPYLFEVRSREALTNPCYVHEMPEPDQHRQLATVLRSLRGAVVLSGYACDLYDQELYADWQRVTQDTHGDSAQPRTEVLWLNKQAADALKPTSLPSLF